MKKLFKLFLALTFAVTSLFITGCNNNDDYSSWVKTSESNSVLLKIGIPSNAVKDIRAATSGRTVVIGGVPLNFVENLSGIDFYSGYLPKSTIYQNAISLRLQIDSIILYVESNFFKNAFVNISQGSQPNAVLTFDQNFNIIKAERNGTVVEKPSVTEEEPQHVDGYVSLSIKGDTITAVVPSELGNVTDYYNWQIRLTSNKSHNSKVLYKGQYTDMYRITSEGNNFFFTITEAGKANLEANTTYTGILESASVYTDKSKDKLIYLTSNNSIQYNKSY